MSVHRRVGEERVRPRSIAVINLPTATTPSTSATATLTGDQRGRHTAVKGAPTPLGYSTPAKRIGDRRLISGPYRLHDGPVLAVAITDIGGQLLGMSGADPAEYQQSFQSGEVWVRACRFLGLATKVWWPVGTRASASAPELGRYTPPR